MIPVRMRAKDVRVCRKGEPWALVPGHPLHGHPCPACDADLGTAPIQLVIVGVGPVDREVSGAGYVTAAAVAVHADCCKDLA